jgi:hypothetical protein
MGTSVQFFGSGYDTGRPDVLWRTPHLLAELIRCLSDHGNYACSHGGVAMLGGDGMDSST